jgi:ADP-heptose:LPS heptosyltransferase
MEQNDFAGDKPYVVLNPAVGDFTRRWSAENYACLLTLLEQELGLPSVLIGSRKDVTVCEAVLTEANRMRSERTPPRLSPVQGEGRERSSQRNSQRECPPPFSLAGQTNLKELAALLQGCTVHICGDTGSAHIGAAVNAPVIGLYGPSNAAHAGPWGQADNVLEHRELCQNECSVRQCVLAPGASSGVEMARCLAEIRPEQVLEAVRRVTKQSHDR